MRGIIKLRPTAVLGLALAFACVPQLFAGQSSDQPAGKSSTPVVLVEYADYQCPFCRAVSSTVEQLMEIYGPEMITLEFKHFPLSFHPDSALAHQAALAAGEQDRFWEMHRLLFVNQRALKREDLIGYAGTLGLNQQRFVSAIDSMKFQSVVDHDVEEGVRLGVNGTPTFFINGRKLAGALPLSAFQSIIEEELARAGVKSPTRILADACTRGRADAPVVLTLFADFESVVSAEMADSLEEILAQYPEDIHLVFKHFPLPIHRGAMLAHEVSLAAAQQGKFWDMYGLLFVEEKDLTSERVLELGNKLELNLPKLVRDLSDHRYRPAVLLHIEDGRKLGVRGVPTLFINSRRVDGLQPISVLRSIVEDELAKAALRRAEPTARSSRPF